MSYDILELSHVRLIYSGAVQSWYKPTKGGLTMNIPYARSGGYFIPDLKLLGDIIRKELIYNG